jgi:AcrR family transcriptional regulator
MRRRAELVDDTRQRIVEAAVRLHTSVGPANTSISGVAEEAGVTRLTVYRHFSDLEHLFVACRADWIKKHHPPDPREWAAIPDLGARARRVFTDLYGWFGQNADDLYPINRDEAAMPNATQEARRAESAALISALVGTAGTGDDGRVLRAVAGHLAGYMTWRSLVVDQGLAPDLAIEVAVRIVTDAVSSFVPSVSTPGQPESADAAESDRSRYARRDD